MSCRGQALLEFAIMGSLALMALGFFIQIGLRANFQQEIEQQNFRRTMRIAKSHDKNEPQSVTLQQYRDRRVPNPTDGLGVMPRTSTNASNTVVWGEFLTFLAVDRNSQPQIVVQLNDEERRYRAEDMLKENKGGGGPCTADFYACSSGCDETDTGCYKDCRKREEDLCDPLPLVKHIDRVLDANGTFTERYNSTRLVTDTTETATMRLNTKDNDSIPSSLSKNVTHDY